MTSAWLHHIVSETRQKLCVKWSNLEKNAVKTLPALTVYGVPSVNNTNTFSYFTPFDHNKFIRRSLNRLPMILWLHFSNYTKFKWTDVISSEHSLLMIKLPIYIYIYLSSASVDSPIETHIGPSQIYTFIHITVHTYAITELVLVEITSDSV